MTRPDAEAALPDYLTPVECASILQCHAKTVVRLIRKGRLPAINLGIGKHAEFRVKRCDLELLSFAPPPTAPTMPPRQRRRRPPFQRILRVS